MRDVDLIPADYRRAVWFIQRAKVAGVAFVIAAVALIAGHRSLQSVEEQERRAIAALQVQQSATTQQRLELEGLQEQQKRLERRLALLAAVRGGPTAESMFSIIDQAMATGGVWFTSWRFRRAGAEVDPVAEAVHTGYFAVLPPDAEHPEAKEWRVETHMEIKGQARDHSALSTFVNRLYDRPEIEDAKVLRTLVRPSDSAAIVDFDLVVVVAGNTAGPVVVK